MTALTAPEQVSESAPPPPQPTDPKVAVAPPAFSPLVPTKTARPWGGALRPGKAPRVWARSPTPVFDLLGEGPVPLLLTHLQPLFALPYNGLPDVLPPFIGSHWIRRTVAPIVLSEALKARGSEPIALVRCDFGGKTRCLKELGLHLSQTLTVAVLYISLDGALRAQVVPDSGTALQALLDRLVFAAKAVGAPDCVMASRSAVEEWLGAVPCILLLDDLHCLLTERVPDQEVEECADFLTRHFLDRPNRHLVFTSNSLRHVAWLRRRALGRHTRIVPLPMMTEEFDPDGSEVSQFSSYLRCVRGAVTPEE